MNNDAWLDRLQDMGRDSDVACWSVTRHMDSNFSSIQGDGYRCVYGDSCGGGMIMEGGSDRRPLIGGAGYGENNGGGWLLVGHGDTEDVLRSSCRIVAASFGKNFSAGEWYDPLKM